MTAAAEQRRGEPAGAAGAALDATDRRIVAATQAGLPLDRDPWGQIAAGLGLAPAEVMGRVRAMLERGIIRRIGAVPNHYALGYKANGMSVWDVPDDLAEAVGGRVGALDFVSHCYLRPRHPPRWPYNLFAMVHGADREAVLARVAEIAALPGIADRRHEVLFSTRILKKTGLRIAGNGEKQCSG